MPSPKLIAWIVGLSLATTLALRRYDVQAPSSGKPGRWPKAA